MNYDDGVSYYSSLKHSTRTPNYWDIVSGALPGPLPENNFQFEEIAGSSPLSNTYNGPRTERNARGHDTVINAVARGWLNHSTPGTHPSLGFTRSVLEGEVSNRLTTKVRDTRFDLGVALGEAGETCSFVANALVAVARSYKQLRRGHLTSALRTLAGAQKRKGVVFDPTGYAANQWLAYSYGLRPLLSDVHDAVDLLDRGLRKEKTFTVRSSISRDFQVSNFWGYYGDVMEGRVRASGKIVVKIDNPTLYSLEQLGLVNPLAVAWELVPFSFVIDWFAPIGTYLTNIVPPRGVSVSRGSISFKGEGTYRAWTDIPSGWHTSLRQRERFKYRKVLTDFPAFRFRIPDISLNQSQVASALSLLYQSLHK